VRLPSLGSICSAHSQYAGEVLNVFTANVFDAKVINAESEGDWEKIVLP
jgi:hypothetical protein